MRCPRWHFLLRADGDQAGDEVPCARLPLLAVTLFIAHVITLVMAAVVGTTVMSRAVF